MFGSQRTRLNELLSRLAADLPEARWVALVDRNGLIKALYPELAQKDRLSAMTAAADSLGGRILKELQGGEMRYLLLGGTTNLHLMIVLNKDNMLALGIRPTASLDALFEALNKSVAPLAQALDIYLAPNWLQS